MHKYVVGGSGSESIHESVDRGVAVQFAVLQGHNGNSSDCRYVCTHCLDPAQKF